MDIKRIIPSFALAICLAGVPFPAAAQEPSPTAQESSLTEIEARRPAHLVADKVEATPESISAQGNVAIDVKGARLLCNFLTLDRKTGKITATGECVFYWQDNFAAAEWLSYDPETQTAILHNVSGQGRDFGAPSGESNQRSLDGNILFWAETMRWTPEKMDLDNAIITTCDSPIDDIHYRVEMEHADIYPQENIIASNTKLYLQDKHIFTMPTMNVSLKPEKERARGFMPQIGNNSKDGFFLRTNFSYAFDKKDYGSIMADYYSKAGIGLGLQHFYSFGNKGEGNLYFYNKGINKERYSYELRNNVYYDLDDNTRLSWDFNSNRSDIPGFDRVNNLSSYFAINHATDTTRLMFSQNYNRFGSANTNTTWRLYYNVKLTPDWSYLMNADLATSTTLARSGQRFHYMTGLRHTGEIFDSEFMLENTSGDATYFLNRRPELTMRSHPIYVGDVPFMASASVGWLEEGPSMFSATRTDLKFQIPDQTIDYGSGRFIAGAGLRQMFYSSGESQYDLAARAGWLQELGESGTIRVDYSWNQPKGSTPFQHDHLYSYENITGGFELSEPDKYTFAVTAGYNLRANTWHQITPRIEFHPGPKWKISSAAGYDPNTSTWRTVDTGLKMQITDELSLSHWNVYDLINSRLTYQDYQLDYETHDWITSLVYRGVQNELYLQFSLKAFPETPVSIGPNTKDPILPIDMRNAFVR